MKYFIEKGILNNRGFPFILKDIAQQKLTGMLSARLSSARKMVFFEKGQIVFVQSSLMDEQLTTYMLRGGVFDDEQYGIVNDLVKHIGWGSPELKELNFIKANTFQWWLKSLIREIIMSLIKENQCSYYFIRDLKPPADCPMASIDTLKLVFACVRRIQDSAILVEWLGDLDLVPRIDQNALKSGISELNLTPQEGFYLSRIDGILNYKQLISLAGPQRGEMIRFFVGALLTGLIVTGTRQPAYLKKEVSATREFTKSPFDNIRQEEKTRETVKIALDDTLKKMAKEETTEDISLTDDELKEIAKFKNQIRSLAQDITADSDNDQLSETVGLDAKLSYLRDGEFVKASDDDAAAIDVTKLKETSESAVPKYVPSGHVSLIIDGEEIDGNENILGFSSAQDIFSSDDAEEQWGRWLTVTVDESDVDYLEEWDENWKGWEEQYNELKFLREHRRKLTDEIRLTRDRDKILQLEKHIQEIDKTLERTVTQKKRQILAAYRRSEIQNHYEILHIKEDADLLMIKESYFKWLKEYQPEERFIQEFEQLAEPLTKLTEKLHLAYEILADEVSRAKYNQELQEQRRNSELMNQKKRELAREHMASSQQAVTRGDQMRAIHFIRASLSLDPHESLYYIAMARLLAENPKWFQEALIFYNRAFHMKKDDPSILHEVASLSIKMDRPKFAEKALQQALKIDSSNAKTHKLLKELKRIYLL